jgi:MerR family redox-sensitive transcriptional activator SoxR
MADQSAGAHFQQILLQLEEKQQHLSIQQPCIEED